MDADKKAFDAELAKIIKHLDGWRLDPTNACWYSLIVDGEGRAIHASMQAKGRIVIRGTWPRDNDNNVMSPRQPLEITVARNRPPEKIAADIERRFLPTYLAAYAEQAEYVKRNNERRRRKQELAVELASLLGEQAMKRMQSNPNQVFAHGLTVNVYADDSINIDIRYTNRKVAKAVLRAYVKAGGPIEN